MHDGGEGLEGTFNDLRTEADGSTPVPGMGIPAYTRFLQSFQGNGWNVTIPHYVSPVKLYATHFLFPAIASTESGAAFQSRTHPDGCWVATYKGSIVPPEGGSFRFVGFGDNIMIVVLDGRLVLDASDHGYTGHGRQGAGADISFPRKRGTPLYFGDWFQVDAGEAKNIEVMVGDEGGIFCAGLFIQKEGQDYRQGANNVPLLPLFSMAPFTDADKSSLRQYLPDECFGGPVWKGTSTSASPFSALDALKF
jgi:hypothetical protein